MNGRWLAATGALALGACGMLAGNEAADDTRSVAGTRWVGVVEGNPDPRTLPRLEFTAAGRMSGFTGCNMMSSSYTQKGNAVTLGPVQATKRFCTGPEGAIEERVTAVVGPQGGGARKEGKLIFTAPGARSFEFVPAAAS